eukprot:s5533_g1.t1
MRRDPLRKAFQNFHLTCLGVDRVGLSFRVHPLSQGFGPTTLEDFSGALPSREGPEPRFHLLREEVTFVVARAVGRKIKGNIDVALLVPSDLPAQLGSQESPSRGWQALGLVTPKHGGGYTSPEESQIDPGLRDLKLGQLPGSSGAVAKTRLLHFDSAAPAQGAIYAQVMLVKIWGSVGRRFAASQDQCSVALPMARNAEAAACAHPAPQHSPLANWRRSPVHNQRLLPEIT